MRSRRLVDTMPVPHTWMGLASMEGVMADQEGRGRLVLNVGWRVLLIAIVYVVMDRLLGLSSGPRPSLASGYLQAVAISLVTGACYALVLLPLARCLPYRLWPVRNIGTESPGKQEGIGGTGGRGRSLSGLPRQHGAAQAATARLRPRS